MMDEILDKYFAEPDTNLQYIIEDDDTEIRYHHDSSIGFQDCHPLDFPVTFQIYYEDEHPELKTLRSMYRSLIEENVELKAIRDQYNDMNEKLKLFKILKGDHNA